ncbi:hypothetical protein QYE76_021118 [Lolium multiflorum]|uniref:CCHC-type domain-containing protein n=1 Tax=Lolium multiflorum TaxID=4521 RepID=A0AAD8R7A4_LOLMU|nr:hypothetical protein QYE76_021118 [Lolium multiflorum]
MRWPELPATSFPRGGSPELRTRRTLRWWIRSGKAPATIPAGSGAAEEELAGGARQRGEKGVNEELKAQVTSLKNDLVKGHEGKCKLDTMLSMQQSPNDKSGLGFKSNNKNKSKNNNKKKGQVQVKDPAKIVCFKCNIEGHHVRSCPLKKKQKGKRPQAQTHIQPQVEEIPLPKKKQANAPIVEKPSEKKEKKRTCYICREKGHISSLCTIGTSSNSITIDDVYSLRCNKKKLMKDIKCQVCLEDEDEVSPQVTSRHQHEEMKCKFKMSQLEEIICLKLYMKK